MKKVFSLFAALSVSLLAFNACQDVETPVNTAETHTVRFVASAPALETKTSFSVDETVVNYSWSDTDQTDHSTGETKRPEKFQVFENGIPATSIDAQLIDGAMYIDATFANTTAESFEYQAMFNAGVKSEQSSSDESYDQYSDVLISNLLTDKDNLLFSFKREVAMAVVTLKGLETGDYLYHVKIESDKPLAGTFNKDNMKWEDTSKTLNIDSFNEVEDGVAKLYLITIPVEEANLKITVETTDNLDNVSATYEKEFTKTISFTKGNVKAFGVNLEGCEALPSVEHNISWESVSDWESNTKDDAFSLTTQPYGYRVVLHKNNGSTAPTVNTSDNDCRLYAKGTASISNDKYITKLVFNISSQGKKRLATITSSVGTIATQASGDGTVVWTGKAKEITFTVGDNATYGSDGSSKAGQLDFISIDATYLDDGTPDPEPEKPTEYNVVIDNTITGGTVTATPISAVEGAEITLTSTPAVGYEFASWNIVNSSTEEVISVVEGKFLMPASDVNVSATFNAIPTRPENEIFYESFDTNVGTGGNDNLWSGSIASNDIKQDNEGWVFDNGSGANKCAKLGASSKLGTATTPALGVACDATLTFKAAAWNGSTESTTLKLSVIDGGSVSPATVTMNKGEWSTFTVTLSGLTANSKVEFEGNANSNSRFFLDEVSIVKTGEATAIYTVTVDSNISNGKVTVSATTAEEGTPINLTATPATGYEFESWIVTGATVADAASATTTFSMPASNVNVSATFKEKEIEPLMTMDEIFAAATTAGSTATDARITFNNWVVSGVKNNNAYLTDNNGKGLVIYASGHGFEEGNILSGTANCKVQLYNGAAELTNLTSTTTGISVVKGGVATPQTISIADLSGVNTGAVLTFEELTYNGSDFTDGANTIKPYNTFSTLPTLVSGKKYSVTGVYIQYNDTKEIAPRTTEDIVEKVAPKYAVTVAQDIANGTVTVDYPQATEGQAVTITATPATGYKVKSVSAQTASGKLTVTDNKFTMPAEAVTVSAEFEMKAETTNEYSFTIQTSDFNTTSYAANNGSHDFTATCTTDASKTMTVACTSNQVMQSSSVMQWKKSEGYIYNTTDLGTIKSVTVNSTAGSFTTYYGTSEHPASGTTVGNGFFTVKVGSATGHASSIVVVFEK